MFPSGRFQDGVQPIKVRIYFETIIKTWFPASYKTLCNRLMPLQEIGCIWSEDNLTRAVTFCGGKMQVIKVLRKLVGTLTLRIRGLTLWPRKWTFK